MKKLNYADKTVKDLQKLLAEKKQALRTFYFGVAGGKVTNVKEARNLRKDVARILTQLHKSEEGGKV